MAPCCRPLQERQGISLLELLVAIAIIAALVAIAAVAVQRSREAAARANCQNNLRQVAIAMQAYHSAKGELPPGDANTGKHGTWLVAVLPHLEEEALFRAYQNFGGPAAGGPDQPTYDREPNLQVTTKRLRVATCPSDTPNKVRYAVGPKLYHLPAHNYATCFGSTSRTKDTMDGTKYAGSAFTYGSKGVKFGEVTDGLSNTLMLAEVRQGPTENDRRGLVWWGPGTSLTTLNPPNSKEPDQMQFDIDCEVGRTDLPCEIAGRVVVTARSRHSGGVNAAMCDGSVRFVADGVKLNTWRAIGSTQGGESVGDF